IGAACGTSGATCASGLSCLSGVDPAVPAFCSKSCTADGDCGGNGARCVPIGTMGSRCVPAECACLGASNDALLDRALAGAHWTRCNLFFTRANVDIFGPGVAHDRFRLPVF